jgi:4-carboxymuconolactone decarboxylase
MSKLPYAEGVAQFTRMVGRNRIGPLRRRFRSLSPDFERCVMGFVGGVVWTRGQIDLKTRSLCSIAILAAIGRVEALDLNIKMALANGATRAEITEVFFQVAVYAGFPAAWDGLTRAEPIMREARSASRRGRPGPVRATR